MTGEREFKPAAQRIGMDRRDDGDFRMLDGVENLRQGGRLPRLAEFGHLGAGGEIAAGADQHDGPRAFPRCRLDFVQQAGTHLGAQRVHRGIGEAEHMHIPIAGVLDELRLSGHGIPSG